MVAGYYWLSADASDNAQAAFAMKPKFHAMQEVIKQTVASRINPGCFWSFGPEDAIGRLGRVASAVHPSTMDARTAERWMLSFFPESRT